MAQRAPIARQDRVVAWLLLAFMVLGSLVLWIGIPVFGLWALSKVTSSIGGHLLGAVLLIPPAMLAFSLALFWMNHLYFRVTGILGDEDDDEEGARRLRGPLEPILVFSLVAAVVSLLVWILFVSPNVPQLQVV
jgi:hypothetical protein